MTAEPAPLIRISHLSKQYDGVDALKDISFNIHAGKSYGLVGPNGAGKTTLIRMLCALIPVSGGLIEFEGQRISFSDQDPRQRKKSSPQLIRFRQKIGFVFQEFNLFNHLNALRNVSIGLEKVKGVKKDEAQRVALEQLERVGLKEHAHKYPAELSGGQKQRVAIARARAMNPVIIFYDEPTSALDPQLIGEVLEVMKGLARERVTSIVVTHEMGFAQSVGDEMLFMVDGRIVERGSPQDLILRCKNDVTKTFFESIQELYGREK